MPPPHLNNPLSSDRFIASNRVAWNRAALAYEHGVQEDVAFLRGGGVSLLPPERRILGDLQNVARAIHLQCSHGLDTLSLLNLGVREVIGIDLSRAMLDQARRKTELLAANAQWIESDVFAVPEELNGSADLVYTGRGALPWVSDLHRWANVVSRLIKPGGRLFAHEGHPLNWVWNPGRSTFTLRSDGRGYFDSAPRANDDFPASAVERFTPEGESVPQAWEWQWTLGQVLTAIASAGLHIERVEEHPEHFWEQFQEIPPPELGRLPHTYSILARKPAA